MSDARLGILLSADTRQADQGLNNFNRTLDKTTERLRTTGSAGESFGRGLQQTQNQLARLPGVSNAATNSLTNLGRVVQDAPFGFLGIANNLNPLLESFQRLRVETGSNKAAFSALGSSLAGPAGLGIALSIASSLLVVFGDKLFGAGKAAKDAETAADRLKQSINGVFSETAKEATQVGSFIAVLKSEAETRERKLAAIKELQKIQPEIFNGLKLEGTAVQGLDNAYKNYLLNLQNVIAAKVVQARLEQKIEELLKKQGVGATDQERQLKAIQDRVTKFRLNQAKQDGGSTGAGVIAQITGKESERKAAISGLEADINSLFAELQKYTKGVKLTLPDASGDKLKVKPEEIEFDLADSMFRLPNKDLLVDKTGVVVRFTDPVQLVIDRFKNFKPKFSNFIKGDIVQVENIIPDDATAILSKQAEDLAKAFNAGLESSFSNSISSFAEGLGEAFTTGDLEGAFRGFAVSIASALQAMGKEFIKIGTTALLAKEAIKKLFANPVLAIAAGAALIAAGAALRSAVGGRFGGFRAAGGGVDPFQSYIVGERGPELFMPGRSGTIVPNYRMNALQPAGAGAGDVQIIPLFRNGELDLMIKRGNKYLRSNV